ncbi:hypothetical protein C8R44DRAFT_726175 [Mycena epipterygia]|nr:hypothetical protein C8R44DRAFT_726175 [Mycena epipterygia]
MPCLQGRLQPSVAGTHEKKTVQALEMIADRALALEFLRFTVRAHASVRGHASETTKARRGARPGLYRDARPGLYSDARLGLHRDVRLGLHRNRPSACYGIAAFSDGQDPRSEEDIRCVELQFAMSNARASVCVDKRRENVHRVDMQGNGSEGFWLKHVLRAVATDPGGRFGLGKVVLDEAVDLHSWAYSELSNELHFPVLVVCSIWPDPAVFVVCKFTRIFEIKACAIPTLRRSEKPCSLQAGAAEQPWDEQKLKKSMLK